MRAERVLTIALSLGALAACGDDEGDGATTSTGGSGNASSAGGSTGLAGGAGGADGGAGPAGGSGGVGGDPGPCVATDADCVACGAATCDAPLLCCSDGTTPACGEACAEDYVASCDGPEDCATGDCCVDIQLSQNNPVAGTAACGSCGQPSGSSASAKSISCRAKSDCAGLTGQFGVPYSECCFAPGFDVGLCVSQTAASIDFDDNCN